MNKLYHGCLEIATINQKRYVYPKAMDQMFSSAHARASRSPSGSNWLHS